MFSQTSYRIGTIFGVPVKVDISLLLVAGMFILSAQGGRRSFFDAVALGLMQAVALFAAILVHEAGHAVVALGMNSRVHGITLMFFGGYASMSNLPRAPLRQAAISLAGPGAGVLLWIVASALGAHVPGSLLAVFLFMVAKMSLYLSVFNMIPALPLDGGNVLRSVLANFKGRQFATAVACRISRWIAVAMGLCGLFNGRLLLILVAFFIWSAASRELAKAAFSDSDDDYDDDVVIISPPPYGKDNEYTRIRRR